MSDWGSPGSNIVTVNVHGTKVQVNAQIAAQTTSFLNALWARGYRFRSVQGFNDRNIAGSNTKSNHAFGAAFDIDPPKNPQIKGVGKTAPHGLPDDVGELAAQHGFVWGGNYKSQKDYMHFEAATGPSTPKNLGLAVVARTAGGGKGYSAAGGDSGMAATAPMNDKQIRDYVISHYGYAASYLHEKEIGPILLDAAKRGLGAQELLGKLQATKWWKTHSDSQIAWDKTNETNPGEAKAQVAAESARIAAIAKQGGVILTSLQVHDLSVLSLRNKWNPEQLNNAMRYHAKIDPTVVKAVYGPYVGLAQTNPEIKKVLDQAQAGNWSQAQFDQAVQGTNWYRTTPESARNAQLGQANDPASTTKAKGSRHDQIVTLARNLGVPDTDPRVNALADEAFTNGWDDTVVTRKLADLVKVQATGNTGQTAITVGSLKQQASDYLVPISDATLQEWTTRIQRGDVPAQSFREYLKEQAKSLFPGMAAAIDSGVTPSTYVDPYRQMAAQTLELPPDQVNFSDPKWSKALFQVDPKTGARVSMSLADWGKTLRSDPSYGYHKTAQAKSQASDMVEQITTMFGAVA